jgi:hypothetical protein
LKAKMKGKNNKVSSEKDKFLEYLGKTSGNTASNDFERQLQKDPFDAEAAEGFDGYEAEQIRADFETLQKKIEKRSSVKVTGIAWRLAATVAIIAAVGAAIYVVSDRPDTRVAVSEPLPVKMPEKELRTEVTIENNDLKLQPGKIASEIKPSAPAGQQVGRNGEKTDETVGNEKDASKLEAADLRAAEVQAVVSGVKVEEQADKKISDEGLVLRDMERAKASSSETRAAKMAQAPEAVLSGRKPGDSLQGMITGVVISSEDRLPVPGASVMIKGTATGTVTDLNGNFVLPASQAADRMLVASFIGMDSREFTANTGTRKEVILDPSVAALNEVVVVGYGTTKAETGIGGAISRVEYEDKTPNDKYLPPEPAGGRDAFKDYVSNELVNPPSLAEGDRAVVVISFNVLATGVRDSIKVLRTSGPEFTSEALRVIKNGPGWKPASLNGIRIDEEVKIRFIFR